MGEIYSMTGYGDGVWDGEGGQYHISVKSVNHRYLDFRVKLPKKFDPWEFEIIKRIKDRFDRGRIELWVNEVTGEVRAGKPGVDLDLANEYTNILNALKDNLKIKGDVGLDTLVRMKGVVFLDIDGGDIEDLWESFRTALDGVFDNIIKEREREGAELKKDMEGRLENIQDITAEIEKNTVGMVEGYRERLTQRISELVEKGADPGRIEQEVVIYSDRSDITEECVRLKSHIEGFRGAVIAGSPAGKRLDFLLQEMFREINTIGSKATAEAISGLVVGAKVEIEKMRQQVQNIE
jgi:uncharacterized protein (TIGR00255 family)